MADRNALIRRLPAVETLGSVNYICSDKTGTLTLNSMKVRQAWLEGDTYKGGGMPDTPSACMFLTAMALCNDACTASSGEIKGEPTEAALHLFAMEEGFAKDALEKRFPRLAEIPFESNRKAMTTFHRHESGIISFTKGAVETVLENSSFHEMADGARAIDRREVLQAAEKMAADGLRVLAVAMKRWDKLPDPVNGGDAERELTLLGLAGLMDPPREEAREAITLCRSAGITAVMITGDHPLTARVIAEQLGILEEGGEVVTGRELESVPFEEFERRVERIKVYARVAPEQKMKIVQALQDRGYFVAMTGDGVNDAPALKRADIGVAMGIAGTEVARESSDMVLLDDNFATIVNAVKEGRRIYANILKFITYSITSNAGTLVAVVVAPFFGLPLPLLPIQILWMNLLCDSLPGLALAAEDAEPDIMKRPPVDPKEGVFASGRGGFVIVYGLAIGCVAVVLQWYAIQRGLPWQTMLFTFLVMNRMAVALSVRSTTFSILRIGPFSNRPLAWAILFTIALQMTVVFLPAMNRLFSTEPLTPWEFSIVISLAAAMMGATELEKWVRSLLKERRAD